METPIVKIPCIKLPCIALGDGRRDVRPPFLEGGNLLLDDGGKLLLEYNDAILLEK